MSPIPNARIIGCLVAFLFITNSCRFFEKQETENRTVIARAYDYKLYDEDLLSVVPSGVSAEDSVANVRNFIDSWTRQKTLLHHAEKSLNDEKKNVTKELEEYRNSLITYAYETDLISKNLDTAISEEEITGFYK